MLTLAAAAFKPTRLLPSASPLLLRTLCADHHVQDQLNNNDKFRPDRSLNVVLLGTPNAGKSSLINALLSGAAACPTSSKTHTTRRRSRALLTRDGVQVVLSDTPGVVTPEEVKRFKLSAELATSPELSCRDPETDLILVVQDVSTR